MDDICENYELLGGQYEKYLFMPDPDAEQSEIETPAEWLRTTFVDEKAEKLDAESVFIPLEAFGDRADLFLSACFDGIPIIRNNDHLYVPASWIIKELPEKKDSAMLIINTVINGLRNGRSE